MASPSSLSPTTIATVTRAIDAASADLRALNLQLYNNPETKFEEHFALALLSDWLAARGWSVSRGVYGLPTAFEAVFSTGGKGGRTLALNAEYDALPNIGHACGHNLIATSTLASAVGAAAALRELDVPATLRVLGTPAEETGGGKYHMAAAGAWDGVSACLMTHPMASFSTAACPLSASWKYRAFFHGRAAHAAAAPWEGANACDAIVTAYSGLAALRQHLRPGETVQGVILKAGVAPNVIPDYAEGSFSLRARKTAALQAMRARVEPIFEGAAAAHGCTVELKWDAVYEDVVTNRALATRYGAHMTAQLGAAADELVPLDEADLKYRQNASSDMGNVTYICPGIQPLFRIDAANLPHTKEFLHAAGTQFAHDQALQAGKANALVALDVLLDDEFFGVVKAEWEETMRKEGRL